MRIACVEFEFVVGICIERIDFGVCEIIKLIKELKKRDSSGLESL